MENTFVTDFSCDDVMLLSVVAWVEVSFLKEFNRGVILPLLKEVGA